MKTIRLQVKKHLVRILMGLGAVLGITACSGIKSCKPQPDVYGPPMPDKDIEVIEAVYGGPVDFSDSLDTINNIPIEPTRQQ